jgi:nucleotide-binding universal stress UspA family protein
MNPDPHGSALPTRGQGGLDQVKTILCPYDFTPACQESLRESVGLAKRLGAAIEVVHVVVTPPMVVLTPAQGVPPPVIDQEELRKTVEAKRAPELAAELDRAGAKGLRVRTAFIDGMHADLAILEHAESVRADLIVMAKHARTAISRFLIGSTTERVLRQAKVPVLVIPVAERKKTP